jgi:hypothetical protein
MELLTPEELAGLADLQLNSLEVHKTPTTQFDVAIKSYVDSKFSDATASATQAVTDLIAGAPDQLNTLNEISLALGNDANLASVLTSQISAVQSAVTLEASNRSASDATQSQAFDDEKALVAGRRVQDQDEYRLLSSTESSARVVAVQTVVDDAKAESKSRSDEDSALSIRINSEVKSREDDKVESKASFALETKDRLDASSAEKAVRDALQVDTDGKFTTESKDRSDADSFLQEALTSGLNQKLEVSANYSGGSESHFKVSSGSYLYIGDSWRIYANNAGNKKRLEFQYSADGSEEGFKVAVPFIRG